MAFARSCGPDASLGEFGLLLISSSNSSKSQLTNKKRGKNIKNAFFMIVGFKK
jgi:predicted amidophosphoribosyltransferase